MDKEKMLSFYEKMYFKEIDEMNGILSRYPILFAGMAIIINIYVLTLKSEQFLNLHAVLQFLFIAAIAFCSIGLLVPLRGVFAVRGYKIIGNLKGVEDDIANYEACEKEIKNLNEKSKNGALFKEVSSEELIYEDVRNYFVEYTTHNVLVNNERRKVFHQTIKWIWLNLVLCISIPLLVASLTFYKDITMSETDKSIQKQEQVAEEQEKQTITTSQLQNPMDNLKRMSGGMLITNSLSKEKYEEYLKQQAEKDQK